jgi:antitoxin component HigA of HigAB toxin-antitoxin module
LIEKYDLKGIGKELEERWTRGENRSSLRELADYFNQQILRTVLESGDANLLEGEVENFYELLYNEEVTSGVRHRTKHRIQQYGVDVDTLEDDFVSYQSIRTYLKDYRGTTLPESSQSFEEQVEQKQDTVRRLSTRLSTVAQRSLETLAKVDGFTLGDIETIVSVRVHCTDCNTQRPISKVLANRGCECGSHEE